MLIFSKYFFILQFRAITIWPFIILKDRKLVNDKTIINHEKIHLKQQVEMLLIIFYMWYIIEFLIHLVIYRNWMKAYCNISFEKEAYQNEHDLLYIQHRRFWAFLKYL
ncbi:MAG: hypothetical protein L3J08_04670 [Flavobacteriaceae bacterium]|nr:hypothetical protein [Flavobacteriaceae bacterium]